LASSRFRVCNPKLVQIVVERDTHNVVEEATEMVPAQVRCPSDIGEGNRLRKMFAYEEESFLDIGVRNAAQRIKEILPVEETRYRTLGSFIARRMVRRYAVEVGMDSRRSLAR
jgi:hypothetical protein